MVSMVGCGNKPEPEPPVDNYHTITFMNVDDSIPVETVKEGDLAVRPQDPTRQGFNFVNWYDDEDCTEGHEHDFSKAVVSDWILYAKWGQGVIHVEEVKIVEDSIECWTNEIAKKKVDYEVLPEGAEDKSVTWKIADETIATINSEGEIQPLSNGSTTIIVRTNDGGFIDTCKLTVKTKAEQISIVQGDEVDMYTGYKKQLIYKITPESTTYKNVTWETSNALVATVDKNGCVCAGKDAGEADITVKTTDGSDLSATCKVIVSKPTPLYFKLADDSEEASIYYTASTGLNIDIECSEDGTIWEDWSPDTPIDLNTDTKLYVRNRRPSLSLSSGSRLTFYSDDDGKIVAGGDTDSMINYSQLTPYCYSSLFAGCPNLVQAPELPSTKLALGCYQGMFGWCSLLATPELPATTLAENCYASMFSNCTHLVQSSQLPATTLVENCYNSMFSGCQALGNAPELPATELAKNCYSNMFSYCYSLPVCPELPATELAEGCYRGMFFECRTFTAVPELPATELVSGCYENMFSYCEKLKINETLSKETENKIFTCPSAIPESAVNYMFSETGGQFKGTPRKGYTYYWYTE